MLLNLVKQKLENLKKRKWKETFNHQDLSENLSQITNALHKNQIKENILFIHFSKF